MTQQAVIEISVRPTSHQMDTYTTQPHCTWRIVENTDPCCLALCVHSEHAWRNASVVILGNFCSVAAPNVTADIPVLDI